MGKHKTKRHYVEAIMSERDCALIFHDDGKVDLVMPPALAQMMNAAPAQKASHATVLATIAFALFIKENDDLYQMLRERCDAQIRAHREALRATQKGARNG